MIGLIVFAGVAYGLVAIGRAGPYLAWLVVRHGRQTRALEALVRANPADATAHRDLAQLWLVRRRPGRALRHVAAAQARDPDDLELAYLAAQARLARGEHAIAAEALQAITARDPRFRYGEPILRAADALARARAAGSRPRRRCGSSRIATSRASRPGSSSRAAWWSAATARAHAR